MPPKRKADGGASLLAGPSKKSRSNATAPSEAFHMRTRGRTRSAAPSGAVVADEGAAPAAKDVVDEGASTARTLEAAVEEVDGDEEAVPA